MSLAYLFRSKTTDLEHGLFVQVGSLVFCLRGSNGAIISPSVSVKLLEYGIGCGSFGS